ncbi:multidrug resistance protein MdtC-like [Tiliqua scincoides]|uniref:multidrug resistance protein MdtC-like n=1 Tax=Tiliqua scincoides TaxID=71010 RepID=UPI0034631E7A
MEGIPKERAEQLIGSPIEREVKSVSGIKKITSVVRDGVVNIVLEFLHGYGIRTAVEDVRARLETVRPQLPSGLDSLFAEERDLSLLPVLNIAVVGEVHYRSLSKIARELKLRIESLNNVWGVNAVGLQDDVVELNFFPELLDHYGIQLQDVVLALSRNHAFVDYGVLESNSGSHKVKLKGLIDDYTKLLDLVLKVVDNTPVATLGDVAEVKLAFKDSSSFARVNGKPCVVLEISKKNKSNIADMVKEVKALLKVATRDMPTGVSVVFLQDQLQEVVTILSELGNTVVFSILLVLVVMMIFMGARTASLVALSIPIAFLIGMLTINLMGYTLNIVILFTLIMVVGMLVDDAIVVSEYADRKMLYGLSRIEAYREASYKMFWPITASTATRLVVFIPLLFWPGVTGEFMKYIPVVSISTLSGSLIMAVVFTPVLGSLFGKASAASVKEVEQMNAIEDLEIEKFGMVTRFYYKILNVVLDHPKKFVCVVILTLSISTTAYFTIGPGIEFFPNIEPERAIIEIKSDSNLSLLEKEEIIKAVENRIMGTEGVKFLISKFGREWENTVAKATIGAVQVEFLDWRVRKKSTEVLRHILALLGDIPGVTFDVQDERIKPVQGKPVEISLSSEDAEALEVVADLLERNMQQSQGFSGVERDNFNAGTELVLEIDRKKAAAYGADVVLVGQMIKMFTDGLLIAQYYPKGAVDKLDVLARFKGGHRSLEKVSDLFINTRYGSVPISSFASVKQIAASSMIKRVNGLRSLTISSNVLPGYLVADRVQYLKKVLRDYGEARVQASFLGDMENQEESGAFLVKAFYFVVLLIVSVLLVEFNSFYYVFIVMTAVFFVYYMCIFGIFADLQSIWSRHGGNRHYCTLRGCRKQQYTTCRRVP